MRRCDGWRPVRAIGFVLIALVLAPSPGCKSEPPPCASCAKAKLANQWCEKCNVGYVAGVPIKSKLLHECLDAHGHELVLSAIECKSCQAAIPVDGFCETCRIGWVRKQAYFSRLTYHLAKGKPVDPAAIQCDVCRNNSRSCGWCDHCNIGMVGNVAIPHRTDFAGAKRGYELMLAAIDATKRCESCGLAIMTDTSCFFCKTTYRDGLPVKK